MPLEPSATAALGAYRPLDAVLRLLPGLALSAALALVGTALARTAWLQEHGWSALTLAILLGMLFGNTVYLLTPRLAEVCAAGVHVSKQNLLRIGIVLYGLRLTAQDIGRVGAAGVLVDALVVASTFALACLLGTRWLGLDRKTAVLIGAGSSICGAAAVLAAEPVVRARADQVSVAVATVVVFGTCSIFLYPVLYALNQHWPLVPGGVNGFGLYIGSTVHEVAQVLAVARSIGPDAVDSAVIAKMVRVMMLAPFLLLLSVWMNRDAAHPARHAGRQTIPASSQRLAVPWFAFGFVALVLLNSLQWLPGQVIAITTEMDSALLAMAMAALGLSTPLGAIRKAGIKPLLLAAVLFAWLVLGGALINRWVPLLVAGN